jgi:DNA-binding NtrC family response regulator
MYYIYILVIDAGTYLGPALRETLESSSFHGIVYLRQSVQELGAGNYTVYLPKIFSIFKFDLAILILPPEFQELLPELKDWIQQQYRIHPILAIIENSESSMAIAGAGTKFQSIPDISIPRILSQIWHFVGQLNYRMNPFYVLPQEKVAADIIGAHPYLLGEMSKVPLAANTESNVFISGPPGTGKKSLAMRIHSIGAKSTKPFGLLCCTCCSWPSGKRSFLGAESPTRESLLRSIKGGTLFLHEIDSLHPAAQINLLDFLESKEHFRYGTSLAARSHFRVISSSVCDAEEILDSGKLQKNLFYRLNIISFHLPPLKDRRDDIPLLAQYFLRKFAQARNRILYMSKEAMLKLTGYEWPGNIRELEYTIRRTVNLLEGNTIKESDIKLPSDFALLTDQSGKKAKDIAVRARQAPENRLSPDIS